jgi:hypothetical protein
MKKIGQITGAALKVIPRGKQSGTSKINLSKRSEAVLSRFETAKDFAVQFNLDECVSKYISIKTNLDGIKANTIKLRELSDCYGDGNISNWIAAWLVSISSKMDFPISTEQATTTSVLILEELYMINISEFTLFFKRLLKGDYGIFYGKFNMQTIICACKEFRMQRGKVILMMNSEDQEKYGLTSSK